MTDRSDDAQTKPTMNTVLEQSTPSEMISEIKLAGFVLTYL